MAASSSTCLGHGERESRRNKVARLVAAQPQSIDETKLVSIKKGPVSITASLRGLEKEYEKSPEWKMVEGGGVLSLPLEDFRMQNLPHPDHSGNLDFGKRKGGKGETDRKLPAG